MGGSSGRAAGDIAQATFPRPALTLP